jgi:hypothetical protein
MNFPMMFAPVAEPTSNGTYPVYSTLSLANAP